MPAPLSRVFAHPLVRLLGRLLVVALALALGVTWLELGAPSADPPWTAAFAARAVQLSAVALILTAQRVGLLTGIVTGVLLAFGTVALYEGQMADFAWVGRFFLLGLKMIIVPMVAFAMVSGVASLGDVRRLGRLGGRTIVYYLATTLIAVVIGTLLVNLFRPGEGMSVAGVVAPEHLAGKAEVGVADLVLSFLSENIVASMAKLEMLPVIVFSLVFGAVVTTLGDKGKPVRAFFEGANEAMMKIVELVMVLAPVGVFGLVAGRFGQELAKHGTDAFLAQLGSLSGYGATVLLGLALHAAVVLPLILRFTTARPVWAYVRGNGSVLMTAFSTASSAATIPLTLEAAEVNNRVDPRAAQFVIPLGATVNMNGTALYEAVAALFIAQAYGIDLSVGQQVLVVIMATLAAIGAAGIPEAGLVTMVMVLGAVGLPVDGIGLILAIDWLLDRFRTAVNVWGDAVGAAVMERWGLEPRSAAGPREPEAEP